MNIAAKMLLVCTVCAETAISASAQDKNDFNPITTGVTSLGIAPDARGASMGDLGAATDPDANSQFWNPSKYAFAYSQGAVSLSYTPWLRKLVNDIFLANLSGYWKLGYDDNQAISASLRYFSLGEVVSSNSDRTINPYEMSVDVGYSRKLSEKFSMGIVFRYIYSDLGFGASEVDQSSGASAFSADIAGYYTTYPIIGRNECQWSWGWDISNIGSKVNFNNGTNPAFLPTNLRIGTSFTFPLADYHNLSLNLDLNKLLVPAMPRLSDYEEGPEGEKGMGKSLRRLAKHVAHNRNIQIVRRCARRIQRGTQRDLLLGGYRIQLQPTILPARRIFLPASSQGEPSIFQHRGRIRTQCTPTRCLLHACYSPDIPTGPDTEIFTYI